MLNELARAKINLTLDITGLRADGYHEVSMLMQTIELADDLTLRKTAGEISLRMDASGIVGGEKIPAAAGLAGGSADAAAVIRGMNQLYDLNLTERELCTIGARVGSDVPFCIVGGTCLAEGRGEILTRIAPMKKFSVILAKPEGEISTAWAYKTYDANPATVHPPNRAIIKQIEQGDYDAAFKNFSNVMESVALKKIPAIADCKRKMLAAGASVALMSGSGPTVFALTDNDLTAEKIAAALDDVQIFITKFH